ncbi:MAG: mechanosensitive ion channel, partial [Gammaproteobacteria bacterium]|nr:mechanosensitive ion channel [Gammaproteobacteria bacterium]
AKWVIVRVGTGIDRLASRAGIGFVARLRWPLSKILAGVVYWLVILFFATAAAESLGLPGLADWLGKLISYLPSVLAAVFIIFAGFVLGGLVRDRILSAALSANFMHAELLGSMVRAIVIILTVVIGLSQMGIDIRLIEYLLTIFAAATLAAFALAFGLGAGPTVSNIIASRNVRRHYRIGQRVRVGEVEGRILELSPSYVILDTEHGRTLIPAKVFGEDVSVLLDSEVDDER